jgi:deoxycytidylate deaminase
MMLMRGPCAKQVVRATIVALNGDRFYGENDCANPQEICPRGDMPSGVGYHLCKDICKQGAHAEVSAIIAAGPDAIGGKLYLEGHTYACNSCKAESEAAGIKEIIIASPPELFQ